MNYVRVLLLGCLLSLVAGVAAGRDAEPIVRIGLGSGLTSLSLGFPAGGELVDERGKIIRSFRAGDRFDWSVAAGKSVTKGRDRRKQRAPSLIGKTLIARSRRGTVSYGGKNWRGTLAVHFQAGGAKVINHLGLEDYVRGVVGGEMGSMSPPESLKAQAVIARTFVLANRGKHGKDGFDLCSREHCQVYGGVNAERPTVNTAVDGTRGVIMIGEGKPISTLYHSTCGGMTSDNDLVFGGGPRSYLRRVRCPFCKAGINYRWTRRIPLDLLRRKAAEEKAVFTRLLGAETRANAPLDRVLQLVLQTDRGALSLKGTTIRRLFNLPSTTFIIQAPTGLPTVPAKGVAATAMKVALAPAVSTGSGSGTLQVVPAKPSSAQSPVIRPLHATAQVGPEQMMVMTSRGLRRVARPSEGWKVLAMNPETDSDVSQKRLPPQKGILSPATSRTPFLDTPKQRGLPLKQEDPGLPELVLHGRGYGHQVGLCQAGAIDQGRRGWSYRQILPYYYTGVLLRRLTY